MSKFGTQRGAREKGGEQDRVGVLGDGLGGLPLTSMGFHRDAMRIVNKLQY